MDEVKNDSGFSDALSEGELSPSLSFRGNFVHSVDEKGRVSLPSEFRKILASNNESRIVLTNYISDGARCLEGFALTSWLDFENKLRQKSRFSAKLQKLENFYLSRAAECSIDSSGRVLLPQHLRSYAGIEKDVTFTSSIHGFRIWDTRVWDVIFAAAEAALMANPDLFADVDI
ncbi:MAG: division/cell wall cluster transcriptional repressor MraZ [Bdellovibrionota bacterium]|jgi:MraZ protein